MAWRAPTFLNAFGERKSLSEWAADSRCSISLRELTSRIKKGMPPEEAITTPTDLRTARVATTVAAFGEEKTIGEWARDERAAVGHLTIRARLDLGWEPEVAIVTPVAARRKRTEKGRPLPRRVPGQRPSALEGGSAASQSVIVEPDDLLKRLTSGAELWHSDLFGERVTLIHEDQATSVDGRLFRELLRTKQLVQVCRIGDTAQYASKAE